MDNKDLPLGTTVYYSIEDYDSGDEVIYEGKITKIYDAPLQLQDTTINIHLYQVADGLSMQRGSFYTLPELFQFKDRIQYLQEHLRGDNNEHTTVYRESTTNRHTNS